MNRFALTTLTASALLLAGHHTQAAMLDFVAETKISNGGGGGTFNISVFDGKAGYGGLASGDFGDKTVEAYYFVTNSNGGTGTGAVTPLVRYAEKNGGILPTPSVSNSSTTGGEHGNANVFTTNDPGVGFSGTPNFAAGVNPTTSGAHDIASTIDITGYTSGTIYLLAGAFGNTIEIDLAMTGTGQTTQTAVNGDLRSNNASSNRNLYVFSFSFDNPGGLYDEISYTFDNKGSNEGNRARFMGVVVDAVPEPGSLALMGLGGLCLLRRRR